MERSRTPGNTETAIFDLEVETGDKSTVKLGGPGLVLRGHSGAVVQEQRDGERESLKKLKIQLMNSRKSGTHTSEEDT
ncbi:hypothetical protein EYF80_024795 [Liparis tanakae]|uniref:Uncharacterized protein n=1 Tax=Liparis tanakae TaxID=230148 RepID=A0A4Z2HH41_9TELE|nr:hypothetical protein EYF80_024795 [Liparis tanakae]